MNDDLAHEVTQLEALLRDQAPKREFWCGIELESIEVDEDTEYDIGWAEHGKFRLLLRTSKFNEDDECVGEEKILLMNAPAELREELHDFLPLFMEEFAEHLKNSALETSQADEN